MMLYLLAILATPVLTRSRRTTTTYDYIVAGAGTSGSILAHKLSDDPRNFSILLIEQGGWSDQWSVTKNASEWRQTLAEPAIEYGYHTQPERYLNNRTIHLPRGRMTGGCGSHNGMIYILGNQKDYDERWNVSGWKWADLAPYWEHIQDTFETTVVSNLSNEWITQFVRAGAMNGYKYNPDPNNFADYGQGGCSIRRQMAVRVNATYAKRQSSWTVYGQPSMRRPNLDVMVLTRVNRLLFDPQNATRVIGVETFASDDKQIRAVYARKEVIVSAGVFNTPRILMLSGIGDCVQLRQLNISCRSHVPGVGRNLQDHTYSAVVSPPLLNQNKTTAMYPRFLYGEFGVLNIDLDGQFYNGLTLTEVNGAIAIGSNSETFHMTSRGTVELTGNSPDDSLRISQNFLSNAVDQEKYVTTLKMARKLIYSSNLLSLYEDQEHEISPGVDVQTDEEILEWGRANLDTDFHSVGTCRMGAEFTPANADDVVVNNQLRVRGVQNLRVADASILPELVSGNTNQIAMIIGFKGADMILSS